MNLKVINKCIDQLYTIMLSPDYDGWRLWELTHQFQENWDIDASDFKEMFQSSFKINSPLWYRDGFTPLKAMERYIDLNEDFVRSMFLDLFNEKRDIAGRISRFRYQCDLLYKEERSATQKVMPHYHDDRKMIHIYLSFRYPDQYALFNFPFFKEFMTKIGSKSIPQQEDIDRFVKVCRTLLQLIKKNDNLIQMVNYKTASISNEKEYPMLLVFDLYSLVNEYELD